MGGLSGRAGPCAMESCEPRQVRKEAAINRILHVPQVHPVLPEGPYEKEG